MLIKFFDGTERDVEIGPQANLDGANLNRANLDGANLNGASLNGASLNGANLNRANLNGANLNRANLNGANLDGANLNGANLNGASLNGASLDGANLNRANLDGASLNWMSHDLIAEILNRAAGDDIEKRKLAGMILISRDLCWNQFLALNDPLTDWALDVLVQYVTDDDNAPGVLKKARGHCREIRMEE